jgi:hypothetical protein
MAVSMSAKAVIRITSPAKPPFLRLRSQSMPERPGSAMSSTMASKWCSTRRSAPSSAEPAMSTRQPRASARCRKLRTPASSSTTSTA